MIPTNPNRAVREFRPGESVGMRYNRLVQHVRATYDPRFVGGVASIVEVDRVERALDTFEREAAEKARRESDADPLNIAHAAMRQLWTRGHTAWQEIVAMQTQRLGSRSSPELKVFNLPVEFFEEPQDVGRQPPEFRTLEEADLLSAELSQKVAALEELNERLGVFLYRWEVPFEKQTRRLTMELFERIRQLEDRLSLMESPADD